MLHEGLIKNKRKTYLLYADNQLIGEFYSVKDIKNIVNFLESKLIKNLKWNWVMKVIINESQLRTIIESKKYSLFYRNGCGFFSQSKWNK